jgi:hypothetical protein
MAASGPTFRWNVLAFVAIVAIALVLSTAMLVLLDPRSQAWWGDRFSELGAVARGLISPFFSRP